jgi:hypothetical protein
MKSLNVFFLIFISLILFSCATDDVIESTSNITTTNIQASTMSDEVIANVESYVKLITDSRSLPTDSVILYDVSTNKMSVSLRDTVSYPKLKRFPNTLVIDFGSGYNSSVYTLKGKLVVYTKDTLSSTAISKKIIYKDFSVGENQMIGSKLITFKGSFAKVSTFSTDSLYYLISSHDTISNKDGRSVCNSFLTKQCVRLGGDTIKYTTTGYAGGVNVKNQKFTSAIIAVNPLIRYSSYPYVVKGQLSITFEDHTSFFDYGDGALDNTGILSYSNGTTKTIPIK